MPDTNYRQQLLQHYKKPHGLGILSTQMLRASGTNPLCGDEIEVGATLENDQIDTLKFSARACSICIASASIMTELMLNQNPAKADAYLSQLSLFYAGKLAKNQLSNALLPLCELTNMAARQKCALLSWQALSTIVNREP